MPKLHAVSPLGFTARHEDIVGAYTIREITDRSMVSITARKDCGVAVKTILTQILNQPAPEVGGYCTGEIEAFWIGQSQWMLAASFNDFEEIVASFADAFNGQASLTEQSDGWCRFSITGPDLERLSSLLCNLDMRGFKVNKANRTTIEHINCFVLRGTDDRLEIIGPRSSAEFLQHVICKAAKSAPF